VGHRVRAALDRDVEGHPLGNARMTRDDLFAVWLFSSAAVFALLKLVEMMVS